MDASLWLSSLGGAATDVDTAAKDDDDGVEVINGVVARVAEQSEPDAADALDSLVSMGFAHDAAKAALEANGGDFDEALAQLSAERAAKRPRTNEALISAEEAAKTAGEPIEVEGVQCALSDQAELMLRLPYEPASLGPVVGRKGAGGAIVFDGMDEWLWELYDSHRPREASLPSSFNLAAVPQALDAGAPYVWDGFAEVDEIRAANAELEAMFADRKMSRGSGSWVDECDEGGHARNRKALEGQQRGDACGFWNLQGAEPAPPPGVYKLFRRLEAAAEQLRAAYGWPLLCSQLGMGAVYDGKGACYNQHRDNEWQRNLRSRAPAAAAKSVDASGTPGAWMNFRELTMLAYVNLPGDFDESETGIRAGGRLRCYNGTKRGDLQGTTARELQDLAPVGGRAVIFRSRELLHEVLPAFSRRYCLTLWFQTPLDC